MCSNVAREAELQQISPRRKCSESLLLSFLYEAFNLFIFSFSLDMDRVSVFFSVIVDVVVTAAIVRLTFSRIVRWLLIT